MLFRTDRDGGSHLTLVRAPILSVDDDVSARWGPMYALVATMRRGSATGIAAAWARYPTIEAAWIGSTTLLRDDRVLRVMIVRNEMPPAFVEWAER